MTDPFEGVPQPSETFLSDVLFPFFDEVASDYELDSAMILAELRRVLRPSILAAYSEWIASFDSKHADGSRDG